jgi:hypothetical protein
MTAIAEAAQRVHGQRDGRPPAAALEKIGLSSSID